MPLLSRWLFGAGCAACDAPTTEQNRCWCATCEATLYPIVTACPRCAVPIESPHALVCARCTVAPPPLSTTTASYRYGGQLAVALRRIKYDRRNDIARTLAPTYAQVVTTCAARADLVMVIPLHWSRMASRGFNQSERLAHHALAQAGCDLPWSHGLRRRRRTRSQSGLTRAQRRANVRGAFSLTAKGRRDIRGRRVLLFDDTMTTGATLYEAARTLLRAKALEVHGFCVARTDAC